MASVIESWREGRAGRIRLNRPRALNALDAEMVGLIRDAIASFAPDPAIHCVIVDAPERGFCAGGDVRGLRTAGLAGDRAAITAFFAAEYAMNLEIARIGKPFICLIDGVCMGGGIGLSVHGSHRIASETAIFAMPETAIALFPDVGMSFVLPRLPGFTGLYFGLTGARVTGAQAVHAGFATHFVESARFADLAAAIVADGPAVIPGFAAPLPASTLERDLIDRVFSAPTVLEIILRLAAEPGLFAATTLAALRSASPLSVFWSFEILRRGAQQNLAACLAAELALVEKVALHPEFFEGVRSVLVDKDKWPKWQPATLEEVDPGILTMIFEGVP